MNFSGPEFAAKNDFLFEPGCNLLHYIGCSCNMQQIGTLLKLLISSEFVKKAE